MINKTILNFQSFLLHQMVYLNALKRLVFGMDHVHCRNAFYKWTFRVHLLSSVQSSGALALNQTRCQISRLLHPHLMRIELATIYSEWKNLRVQDALCIQVKKVVVSQGINPIENWIIKFHINNIYHSHLGQRCVNITVHIGRPRDQCGFPRPFCFFGIM